MSLNSNTINQSVTDWNALLPLISEEVKSEKTKAAIFKSFSTGIETNLNDWMYDLSGDNLERKIAYLNELSNKTVADQNNSYQNNNKPNSDSENYLRKDFKKEYEKDNILTVALHPFCKLYFYFDEYLISKTYQWPEIFQQKSNNIFIATTAGNSRDFFCLGTDTICDVHFADNSQCIPLYSYTNEKTRQDNITDWAHQLFNDHYRQNEPASPVCYAGSAELREEFRLDIPAAPPITKEAIFHYVYAVLHHPAYRKKYGLNLKREFPRIPLYDNFQQWSAWGKRLMDLHINYETVAPYPLERKDVMIEPKAGINLDSLRKALLKAHKEEGEIVVDAVTTLSGIPKAAWDYKLGNRSALEWILDQYKEKKPGDPTIAEHFNTYRFSDYKEQVIDLLQRVCTVSVETIGIVGEMDNLSGS